MASAELEGGSADDFVLALAGAKEAAGSKPTVMPSTGVAPLRVVTVTLTGAVIEVWPTGMYCGELGPVPLPFSLISTAANGLNFLTVPPVLPPVVPA